MAVMKIYLQTFNSRGFLLAGGLALSVFYAVIVVILWHVNPDHPAMIAVIPVHLIFVICTILPFFFSQFSVNLCREMCQLFWRRTLDCFTLAKRLTRPFPNSPGVFSSGIQRFGFQPNPSRESGPGYRQRTSRSRLPKGNSPCQI
ncbi:hypothetical protein Q0601_20385 [Paracoccus onubensis]|uniref:hypothetical protein n=1 Tax=Paracoccus onubensis TaxID=1675788 RepID=UPI00273090CD|nr:hypothetical protein [Paracoccus onubensis]MDP0929550.1 hypothetical protein [Paracoccus onubensis]